MNNEKLILRVLMELLLDPNPKERLLLATEITKVLNPKEVVPYENSLDVCENPVCGHTENQHDSKGCKTCRTNYHKDFPEGRECREFVKSSINEKGEKNNG